MKYLTNLDLNKNELQNVVIQTLATAPSSGKLGQIYYNSTDKVLYQHDGTAWKTVGKTVTYEMSFGELASNTVPINLIDSDGTTDTINLKGAGGATLSLSGNTLTITTANTNTTYAFAGAASASNYKITITPSSGSAQTITIPLVTATAAGLLNPADKEKLDKLPYEAALELVDGDLKFGLKDAEGLTALPTEAQISVDAPLSFEDLSSPTTPGDGVKLKVAVDSSMSASSANPVQNKVVKAYVDNAIANLPEEQFLDLTKTEFVENFTWSNTTYPGSTNPNLEGKPVLVLALKSEDGDISYSFVNLEDLITTYTGEAPIVVSGSSISHANSNVSFGTYGGTTGLTPNFGETFNVPRFTVDAKGHLTQASDGSVKIPDNLATITSAGLLSSSDKIKLNKLPYEAAIGLDVSNNLQFGLKQEDGSIAFPSESILSVSEPLEFKDLSSPTEPGEGVKLEIKNATVTTDGLMSSEDKQKLDGIDPNAISVKLVSDTLQAGNLYKEIRWSGLTKIVSVMAHYGDYPVIVDWVQINSAGIDVSIAQQYNQDITIDIFYI